MAMRRMFSNGVIDSDGFLDLPSTAQLLYFHAGMKVDDDGFVTGMRRIMRLIGATDDDLAALIESGFLIPFPERKVFAITHHRANNEIKRDRYHPTICQDEFNKLAITENREYKLKDSRCFHDVSEMFPNCLQDVSNSETESDQPGQSGNSMIVQVNQVREKLAAEGWTMADIETAINRCRGKEIKRDLLQYVRKILENMKKERPITLPTVAQDFNQRSYDGVDEELKAKLAAEMAEFKASQQAVSG